MSFFGEIAIIAGGLAAIGLALDKIILKRHDSALKTSLTAFWVRLYEISPQKLPRYTARLYLDFVRRFIGPDITSIRFLITSILISFVMTTVFFFIGKAIRHAILASIDPSFPGFFESFSAYIEMYQLHLDKKVVYPVNVVFDILTIMVTTVLVTRFFLARNMLAASRFIVVDIVMCCFLFYTCLFIIVKSDLALAPPGGLLTFHKHVWAHLQEPAMFAHWLSSGMAYSATVFYPTILYLSIFLILLLASIVVKGLRVVGLFYAESAIENEKSAFFVTGTFLGILAASAKVISSFL